MLDFLQGKEIAFKEELIEFIEIMKSLENVTVVSPDGIRAKLSPGILLVEILNADFILKEFLLIFLDLRDFLEKIQIYSQITKKGIMVRFSSDRIETRKMNDLISIAENELNVNPYGATFVVENSTRILNYSMSALLNIHIS